MQIPRAVDINPEAFRMLEGEAFMIEDMRKQVEDLSPNADLRERLKSHEEMYERRTGTKVLPLPERKMLRMLLENLLVPGDKVAA